MGSAVIMGDAALSRLCAEHARAIEKRRSIIRVEEQALWRDESEIDIERRLRLADHYHVGLRYRMVKTTLQPLVEARSIPSDVQARAKVRMAWAEFFLGNLGNASQGFEAAIEFFGPTDHHADLAMALRGVGATFQAQGDLEGAIEKLHGALAAANRRPDAGEVRPCLSALGMAFRMAGEYRRSIDLHLRCLQTPIATEHATGAQQEPRVFDGRDHLNLSVPQYLLGCFDEAWASAYRAAEIFESIGSANGFGMASIILCRIARHRAEFEEAREYADISLRIGRETKYKRLEVLALEEIADCQMAEDNPRAVAETLEEAHRIAVKIAPRGDLVYESSWRLSRACRLLGQISRARQLAESAVEMASTTADVREHALSKLTLALVRNDLGYRDEARQLTDEVIEALRKLEALFDLAQAHEIAATFALDGDRDETRAIAHLHEAVRLYSRTGVERAVRVAEERLRQVEEAAGLPPRSDTETAGAPGTVIAVSQAMRQVVRVAQTLADYENAVLIEGPTGCGKEVVARLIHASGAWADRPFTPLNCAALPMHLLESEMFGHRRGAFTGAERDHVGHLEAAGDGIVFLDELDKTNKVFQAKFLRVLEDRRFFPVGETQARPFRARILCASNRDLRRLVDNETFLPDLYYRLAAGRIEIPPLRDRPEDVEALAETYLDRCCERYGTPRPDISSDVRLALMAYAWPGNVRELKNVIELAAFYARGEKRLRLQHLPVEIAEAVHGESTRPLSSHIEEVERREIELAMRKAAGNRTDAAKILGVSRKGLLDRLRRLRIEEW